MPVRHPAKRGAIAANSIANIVEDLSPQLGANLDLNNFDITGIGNINISTGKAYLYSGTTIVRGIPSLNNWFLGDGGNLTMSGGQNIALGGLTLIANTSGINNTAINISSLAANTTASNNTAIGVNTLKQNTTGGDGTAVGVSALRENTTGIENAALGRSALRFSSTGIRNTAVGFRALNESTTGSSNTAVGAVALFDIHATSLEITEFADHGATVPGTVKATSVGHGRSTSNSLIISGSTDYNGTFTITVIDVDNFYFTDTWVADQPGWWTLAGSISENNTAIGVETGRGIVRGSGNTILGANVAGLGGDIDNHIILASGDGVIKARHDGTDWALTGALSITGLLKVPDGTAAAPAVAFTSDPNTGIFSSAPDRLAFSVGGVLRAHWQNNALVSTVPFRAPDGTVGAPAVAFTSDLDTGMLLVSIGVLGFSVSGTTRLQLQANAVITTVPVRADKGTVTLPGITFNGDSDTGLYDLAPDIIGFTTGAVERARLGVLGLKIVAGFGCNGKTAQTAVTVNANSTDLASVIALCNQLRAALIANGITI